MPLSELTTESYFKTATLVRDWRDYHFCGRMFHPPLLASNLISFLPLLKQGYLFNLLLLRHFASLNFGGTAQNETGFPYMC